MATLEEIAQQFEDALGIETGTTIKPGTVTPQGATSVSSGKRKLSWPEIVERMGEGIGVGTNEILPDVPKGVSAQKFYRASARSGLLPSGASTFTSSPFGSFSRRIGVASGVTTADTSTVDSNVPAPVVAPKSVVQTRQEQLEGGNEDERDYVDPTVNPNLDLTTLLGPGGIAKFAAQAFSGKGEKSLYTDISTYSPAQIGQMINDGVLNSDQVQAYQQGITEFNSLGEPVDKDGVVMSKEDYYAGKQKDFEYHPVFGTKANVVTRYIYGLTGGDDYSKGGFEPGYQDDGTFVNEAGQGSSMGSYTDFESLIENDPEMAGNIAETKGRGTGSGFLFDTRLAPELYDRAMAAREAERSRNPQKTITEKILIKSENKNNFAPALYDFNYDFGGTSFTSEGRGDTPADAPTNASQAAQDTAAYESLGGSADAGSDSDSGFGDGSWGSGDAGDEDFASGGRVGMQDGGEAEMANLGMINEQAAGPQNGGQQSVKDDIPREADAGDYILPYETVLEVGLKQLNRYAKEAIQLAIKNGVNLKGTDLDPSDDVPIKVSNYEYHIPKGLVPYFGGGKKYLDKIRNEGLALRKRLEEEKQPSVQEQQPLEQNPQPAPQPQMVADAQPEPQMPMMQKGGFVNDPVKAIQSAEQVLAQDTSQPAQSAYNQMQAIERSRVQSQQPPMVNPDGKVVQQGFAAPQGYALGTPEGGVPEPEESQLPETQMETSANQQNSQEPVQMADAGFDEAFKNARDSGSREFEFNGKKYNTVESDDEETFKKIENLPIDKLMALTALGEARSEGREGMRAVMHVIRNRVKSGRDKEFGIGKYENPYKSVILNPGAFSALSGFRRPNTSKEKERTNFKQFTKVKNNNEDYIDALEDAGAIMRGELEDPTKGSLFYVNEKTIKSQGRQLPSHLKNRTKKIQIGNHSFYNYNMGGFVDKVIDT